MDVAKVKKLSPPEVRRRMKAELLESVNAQTMTVRCKCGWYMRGIRVGDGKRAYAAHRERCGV